LIIENYIRKLIVSEVQRSFFGEDETSFFFETKAKKLTTLKNEIN